MQPDEMPPALSAQPRIQIFILSRDRPHFLREALESALAQEGEAVEVVVSDNSEGDGVSQLIATEFPDVRYIRRRPTLPIDAHHNAVMGESTAKYVVYFHDDDVLEAGYATAMAQALDAHPNAVAAACNAWTILRAERIRQPRMGAFHKVRVIRVAEDLIEPYLDFTPILVPPPTPGYMYRRHLLEGVYSNLADAGIYGDVAYFMRLIERGEILWLPEPLMWYREHGKNTSSAEDVPARLRLLRYIYTHSSIRRHAPMVTAYRFRYWLNWWLTGKCGVRPTPWRGRIVGGFLLSTALRFVLVHPGFWLKLLAKLRRGRRRPHSDRKRPAARA